MKNSFKIVVLSLLASIFMYSCKDDDSVFSGEDNYITSFQLTQGDLTLDAFISPEGEIKINAPENLSLSGAVATVVVSELASITPNPVDISDWNHEQSFEVTSYNGSKKNYTYTVTRKNVSTAGDVVLLTQEDVESLGKRELNEIKGSLIIGAEKGNDSIYSLAPLSTLKTIQNGLTIASTYAGEDLNGLENLEAVGAFVIEKNKTLKSINLPKLQIAATGFSINQSEVETLTFPQLKSIDKTFKIQNAPLLKTLLFPVLQQVAENLTLEGNSQAKQLKNIDFPVLKKVGGDLNISQWEAVESIHLPMLESVIGFAISSMSTAKSIVAPKLETVHGTIRVVYCSALEEMNLTAVKNVAGALSLDRLGLTNLDGFKSIESLGKELFLSDLKNLTDSKGLRSLKSVGERVYLSTWPLLQDNMEGLKNLSHVGGDITIYGIPFKKFAGFKLSQAKKLSIFGTDVTTIEEIDISKLTLTGLSLERISNPFILKGPKVCDYAVKWDNCLFNSLEGFEEIKNLNYAMDPKIATEVVVDVKKIGEQITLRAYNMGKVSFPNLTEVAYFYGSSTPNEMEAPKLKKLGRINIDASTMSRLMFPVLEVIEGDCKIESGTYNSQNKLVEISMPKLTTIKGILDISGYSSNWGNKVLTNLNGFSSLKSVKGIRVTNNFALTDFSGLQKVISSVTSSDWTVQGNAYNPTYQDMIDGIWVKP